MAELLEPRPNHATVAATLAMPPVLKWLASHDKEPVGKEHFLKALKFVYEREQSTYTIAKYAEENWSWPSDTKLVMILEEARIEAFRLHDVVVHDWVTRTGIRFPRQVREAVLFRDVDGELCHGIVQNVFPTTAEAIVAVITDIDDRSRQTPMIKLRAEEIIERAPI